ncbi:MAG: twin-arginine translocase subunit TatC [Thermoplasmatota archaeon]
MRRALAALLLFALLAPLARADGVVLPSGLDERDVGVLLVEGDTFWTVRESVAYGGSAYFVWLPSSAQNLLVSFPGQPNATVRAIFPNGPDVARLYGENDQAFVRHSAGFPANVSVARVVLQFTLATPAGSGPPPLHMPGTGRTGTIVLLLAPDETAPAPFHPAPEPLFPDAWRADLATARVSDVIPLAPSRPAPEGASAAAVVVISLAVVALALGAFVIRRLAANEPTEGGLLVHLRALQRRILAPLYAFALFNLIFFAFGARFVSVGGLSVPILFFSVHDSIAAVVFRALVHQFVPAGVTLIVTRPVDAVLAELEITLFLAIVATLPLLAYALGGFIAPALASKERRLATRAVPVVVGLFLLGAAFAVLLMIPTMMRTLYGYTASLGAAPLLAIEELVSFALIVTLVFGLAFELPAAMFVLSRVGLVKAEWWGSKWRHAIVAIFIIAAVVTPDPSVVSQFLVAVPLCVLYFVGWGASALGTRRAARV